MAGPGTRPNGTVGPVGWRSDRASRGDLLPDREQARGECGEVFRQSAEFGISRG